MNKDEEQRKLQEALDLYDDVFSDTFPTFMLGINPDEVKEIVDKCVTAKKDVYEMGYLSLDEDILY